MKHTLIIVDPQYDFIEGGKLPVAGGTEALNNVVDLIKSGDIGNVVITQDWHPGDHCSFGEFPEHCVQNTHGAQIYEPILDILHDLNIYWGLIRKGQNSLEDNFSALLSIKNLYYDTVEFVTEPQYEDCWEDLILSFQESIIVCGIAGDICVLNTLKMLNKVKEYFKDFYVFKAGTASLDGGNALSTYMINNDIKNYE
jgi:nicotinamidase/pyrazinamidase